MTTPTAPDWSAAALRVTAPTPAWFDQAIAAPVTSRFVLVDGCPIHYLLWPGDAGHGDGDDDDGTGQAIDRRRGLLFVHGGGAHANWWRFIAPFFGRDFRCVAIDLSGMGESGRRPEYSAAQRSNEIRAVLADANLGARPFVVGHSFGGYMTMRFGADYGEEIGGAVIVDSPIRRPAPGQKPSAASRAASLERHYPSFEIGRERFRLLPPQECANDFLVEFIARHSLMETERGWTWKFDARTMTARRADEPFHEHLVNMRCRRALIYGELSALVDRDTAAFMSGLMGPRVPIVEIPQAQHHLLLDQPLAFVSALRLLLDEWVRAESP